MTRFKSGDKVRCISPTENLQYNGIYEVMISFMGGGPIASEEIVSVIGHEGSYFATRFLPCDDALFVPKSAVINTRPQDIVNFVDEVYVSTKAAKNDSKKVDLSLIPYVALKEEAKAFMVGEKKYGRLNYLKGHKNSQLVAAAMRHLLAWNEGEEWDPVDGQHHLGSVRACCAMILRQIEVGTFVDDRK